MWKFDRNQISRMNLDPRLFSVDEDEDSEREKHEDPEIETESLYDSALDEIDVEVEDAFSDISPRPENTWVNTSNAWEINTTNENEWTWWAPRDPLDIWNLIPVELLQSKTIADIEVNIEMLVLLIRYNGYSWVRNACESEDHKSFITKIAMQTRSLDELRALLQSLSRNEKANIFEIIRHLIRKFELASNDIEGR